VKRITSEEMARISHFPTPSAVLAVGRISRPALPTGGLARGLTLALDGVQDPGESTRRQRRAGDASDREDGGGRGKMTDPRHLLRSNALHFHSGWGAPIRRREHLGEREPCGEQFADDFCALHDEEFRFLAAAFFPQRSEVLDFGAG